MVRKMRMASSGCPPRRHTFISVVYSTTFPFMPAQPQPCLTRALCNATLFKPSARHLHEAGVSSCFQHQSLGGQQSRFHSGTLCPGSEVDARQKSSSSAARQWGSLEYEGLSAYLHCPSDPETQERSSIGCRTPDKPPSMPRRSTRLASRPTAACLNTAATPSPSSLPSLVHTTVFTPNCS